MNILGISGSPNSKGNTAYTVNYALEVLKERGYQTKYISLSGKKIKPCIGCWKCSESYTCFQKDDMEEILDAMKWSHGLLIGSPVYFGMITGQLKTMMDRCVVMRPNYGDTIPMSGKTGGAIACAYSRNGGQEYTIQNIHTFMLQMNMSVIGDGPNYHHSGATIFGEHASDDLWGLETAKNLALNLAANIEFKKYK
ncbi:MAG: flavodoxin family protein [Bacteroidales bacterium]|nr:flavodoxin family protein [Bacteroidales bacterium]